MVGGTLSELRASRSSAWSGRYERGGAERDFRLRGDMIDRIGRGGFSRPDGCDGVKVERLTGEQTWAGVV